MHFLLFRKYLGSIVCRNICISSPNNKTSRSLETKLSVGIRPTAYCKSKKFYPSTPGDTGLRVGILQVQPTTLLNIPI